MNIRAKIGLGFSVMILVLVIAIIEGMSFVDMGKINNDVNDLSKEYIPLINKSYQVNELWNETNKILAMFNVSGDEYYIKKNQIKLNKLKTLIADLVELTAKSKNFKTSNFKFITIQSDFDVFTNLLSQYAITVK